MTLHDAERYRLYFGKYKTPRFTYGKVVECEIRGPVEIVGLSDAPIPWPIGRPTTPRSGRDSLIIFKGLKRAVEQESRLAVAHWWGVAPKTVSAWRQKLGVKRDTKGTAKLVTKALREETRRAKIATTMTGRPRPKHVMAKV